MRAKSNWQKAGSSLNRIKSFIKKGGIYPWYWIYRFKWNYYPLLFRVDDYPTEVLIETSSVCNLNCIMCYRNFMPKDYKYSIMDFGLFKKIIDECKKNKVAAVKLSWRGEVLLNKNFVEMVKYAKEAGIKEVSTLSNATKLTPKVSAGLVKAGLDQLIISLDGITKETYEKIRKGANFEETMTNIKRLIEIKGKRKKPIIRIQITEIPENKEEIDSFLEYWGKRIDETAVSGFIDFSNVEEGKEPEIQDILKKAKGRLPCPSLWRRLAIMADGTVTICCVDILGKLTLGNIKQQSLKSLWNSSHMNAYRKIHRERKLNSIETCKRCNERVTYQF